MKIWLTLDSLCTYLVDGVPGCGVWITEPTFDVERGWSSPLQPIDGLRVGKRIIAHAEVERIDNAIMSHFIPDIDLALPRQERLEMVLKMPFSPASRRRPTLLMTIEVTPQVWFDTAMRVGDSQLCEVRWAQKVFDPAIPF